MTQDPLLAHKLYYADIIYKNLTGLTRSEEASLKYYALELEKQNATEEGFRKFSTIAGEMIIGKICHANGKSKPPSISRV